MYSPSRSRLPPPSPPDREEQVTREATEGKLKKERDHCLNRTCNNFRQNHQGLFQEDSIIHNRSLCSVFNQKKADNDK